MQPYVNKSRFARVVLLTVVIACGCSQQSDQGRSSVAPPTAAALKHLSRVATALRRAGFPVRVVSSSDPLAHRLGASRGLVGLVISRDSAEIREEGFVVLALFETRRAADQYYRHVQDWGNSFSAAMNAAHSDVNEAGRLMILFSNGRVVRFYLPINTVPDLSTSQAVAYGWSRRNEWQRAQAA